MTRDEQIAAWKEMRWKISKQGAKYLQIRDWIVSVLERDTDEWRWRIRDSRTNNDIYSETSYDSESAAIDAVLNKLADKPGLHEGS